MGDAGFYRGTSSEQDSRFTDKQKKLLKTMRFEDSLARKVVMKKVNLDVIKPWITQRINEILGIEDDVVIEYVFSQLEEEKYAVDREPSISDVWKLAEDSQDPRVMQINLTGFLNAKKAREFMGELWTHLADANDTEDGIPPALIQLKKIQMEKQAEEEKANAISTSEIKAEIATFNRNNAPVRRFSPERVRGSRWESRPSRFSDRERNGRVGMERRDIKEEFPAQRERKREEPPPQRRDPPRERPRRPPEPSIKRSPSPPRRRKSKSPSPERRRPRRRFTEDKRDGEERKKRRRSSSSSNSDSGQKTRETNSRRRKFREATPPPVAEKPRRRFREVEGPQLEDTHHSPPPAPDSDIESQLKSYKTKFSEATGVPAEKTSSEEEDTQKKEEGKEDGQEDSEHVAKPEKKKKKKKHKKHKKQKKQKKAKKKRKEKSSESEEEEDDHKEPDAKKQRTVGTLENELREKALKSMSQQKSHEESSSSDSN